MTEFPTLLPCPFCGGDARIEHIKTNPERSVQSPTAWRVTCTNCFARTLSISDRMFSSHDFDENPMSAVENVHKNISDVISYWNRRVSSEPKEVVDCNPAVSEHNEAKAVLDGSAMDSIIEQIDKRFYPHGGIDG